jgi:hypothetical protein
MARSVSHPGDQAATLRNLKVLVVLLVVSNILVGVLGVYLLRLVDRRYSDLVTHTVPVLNDLQTLTAKSVAAMRSTNPVFFEAAGAKLEAAVQHGQSALVDDRTLRAKLLGVDWLPDTSAKRKELQQAGDTFTQLGNQVLTLFATEKSAEAARVREEVLRPAFERYQTAVTKISDVLVGESTLVNNDFTAKTSSFTTLVLGVASWPVIALVGLLLLTAVFVIAMMIAFRGKDLADTP